MMFPHISVYLYMYTCSCIIDNQQSGGYLCVCVPKSACISIRIFVSLYICRYFRCAWLGSGKSKVESVWVGEEGLGNGLLRSEWLHFLLILFKFMTAYGLFDVNLNICFVVNLVGEWWLLKLKSWHYIFYIYIKEKPLKITHIFKKIFISADLIFQIICIFRQRNNEKFVMKILQKKCKIQVTLSP